jgi:hypothetical protein
MKWTDLVFGLIDIRQLLNSIQLEIGISVELRGVISTIPRMLISFYEISLKLLRVA